MSRKTARARVESAGGASVFARGTIVLVSLNLPREKYWGAILELTPAGVSLRGIELTCFEDFARQVKAGEAVTPNAVFFPMHRVERIELDSENGEIPSLQKRFADKAGRAFRHVVNGERATEPGT
jgi:hypothetical protein